jgi:PAN domain
MGVPVWVPWTPVAEAEYQRLREELQRQTKAAADAEAKREAAEAELRQIKDEVEHQTKAAADAEERLKLAESEQQRLVAIKAEEQRQIKAAADVDAKRRAAEAEQQRLVEIKAAAVRKAEEAEQQRLAALRAEEERKAKAEAEAAARSAALTQPVTTATSALFEIRSKMEGTGPYDAVSLVSSIGACERYCAQSNECQTFSFSKKGGTCFLYSRPVALQPNEYFDSGLRNSASPPAAQSAPTVTSGLFTMRTNTEAIGSPPVDGKPVRSIDECEQSCTQSATCKIFTFRKSTTMCYTYSDATFMPSDYFDTGIRK